MFKYSVIIALTFIIALGAVAETDPVEVLQSTASLEQKVEACRLISISGDVKAIPVLAALLADEQLSHMARYALEPMQEDAAGAALRRALKTTSGKLKAGVVDSLGMRRDVLAVPALIQLLDDDNSFVVEASVRSLGRIAVPEGIEALKKHLVQPDLPYAIMQSLGDGLFAAAEHALAEGNPDSAVPLYDAVYAVETLPVPIRAAALRGAVLARTPQDGLPLLIEAITGENAVFYTVSLRTALEMEDKGNTATGIAAVLPGLSADRKIQVMQTIGELGQNSVGPALLKEAGSGIIPVRVAALDAAVRVAYAPVLPVLRELLSSEDADLLQAARRGLAYFPGKEGDAVVMDMLKSDDVKIRIIAVELISQGALPTPVELLMKIADGDTDDSIRVAAIKGVKEYAGIDQMSGLLSHLFDSHSHDEMIAAEEVL
ncbi:MAG: HEAT repeat domain-containing protein, partial [Candidatus Hydrogenedentes bacterium]|nr:HEAT repeat domain-containing protein [Candidatus Hydrogenedentota bacterium]